MSDARLLTPAERRLSPTTEGSALDLAARLPSLVVAAKEIASSVMHGVHGRRVAGSGETFWQFRPFVAGESTAGIDWRRSARDDRIYVREREWEGAHTVWIWVDRSPSMAFTSRLALRSKLDRALVLGLAAADLLVHGGERVGLMGLTHPMAVRGIVGKFAEAMLAEERSANFAAAELPPRMTLAPRTQAILISDFLSDPAEIGEKIQVLSSRGARGHLIVVSDPIEETFPFAGHTEFLDVDSEASLRAGQAESFRGEYLLRLAAHREAIAGAARRRGWNVLPHRTDRPASEALLALRARLEADPTQFTRVGG